MPQRHTLQAQQAVILAAVQLDDVELLLHQGDEGQEQFALQPAFIKLVGLAVGRRHHDDAIGEQRGEQATEDGGVGDVGDLKLVETEQPGLARDFLGEFRHRIGLGAFGAQAPRMQALMHLDHEGVEMHAPLVMRGDRSRVVKQVHQHGLAAPDRAEDI